jgi:GNAT superfamily N-acetyltransferase
MPDLLVPLYKLPPMPEVPDGFTVRRAYPFELSRVRRFIETHFAESWADEAEVAFARQPICVWIAVHEKKIVGFSVADSTARGYFGPTGVDEAFRGKGLGGALLFGALYGLKDMGYAYAIIGAAGPVEFYEKAVGAIVIPDSSPGIYVDMLARDSAA